jgi:serine/threonine protein kinase/Flp pilus assembly protein TadD
MNETCDVRPENPSAAQNGRNGAKVALDDPRVVRAVEEFMAALEAGQKPARQEFLARYPDIVEALSECLAGLEFVQELAPELSKPGGDGLAEGDGPDAKPLGDFRIVREIGRGGMGIVYEAEQMSLGRRVALKVLPFAATMDPRHLQRFKNEAQAAAGLHHPNIVPVHYVGCERGVHFFAMQLIEGQTLAAVLQQLRQPKGPAPAGGNGFAKAGPEELTGPSSPAPGAGSPDHPPAPSQASTAETVAALNTEGPAQSPAYFREVARLGIQAAEALEHAHQLGVVHRDVKPGNLLLDGRGNLWVTDFGLARLPNDPGLTMTGDLIGTLRYMSPEQALAKRVVIDHRTDVYSLGATLYELLTLRPVFDGKDRQELLRQIAFEEPRPPRRWNKAIPAELETIVLKALEKNPAERYATAQELADDLRRFQEDKPILAKKPTLYQRVRKWGRRHRPLVGSVAAVLAVTVLLLSAGIGWLARDREARRAETERVVREALQEPADWQRNRRLPEALSAARRAAGLLAGGEANETLRRWVRARVADLELLDALENARLELSAGDKDHFAQYSRNGALGHWRQLEQSAGDKDNFANVRMDGLCRQAFLKWGVDVEALPPKEAGARIRESTVADELAAALDQWALIRRRIKGRKDTSSKHLLAVARAADLDGVRNEVRDALKQRDLKVLLDLVARPDLARRLLPSTYYVLVETLQDLGEAERAVALMRAAQRWDPGDFWVNHHLAYCLANIAQPPRLEEAIRYYTAALALRPRSLVAHLNLGKALSDNKDLDGAIAEYEKAIALQPNYIDAYHLLGLALEGKGDLDGAIAKHIAAYRRAFYLKKEDAEAHYKLGIFLTDEGRLHQAIAAYAEAIRFKNDFPEAHCNLSKALVQKGWFAKALVHMRRGHELGSKNPRWPYPSAQWVNQCERLVELDTKLPQILKGQAKPADAAEQLAVADLCQQPFKKLYAAAAYFYAQAFGADPRLANNLQSHARYNAACAAALAAGRQGKDAALLQDKECARLRHQALTWLQEDLAAWTNLLDKAPVKVGPVVQGKLKHWQQDTDLARLRDPAEVAKLPKAEYDAWKKLWAAVEALRKRAAGRK